MNDLKLLGKLYQTSEGDVVFVPARQDNYIKPAPNSVRGGKIVRQPTPDEARIDKEKVADLTLDGVLKKTKKDEKNT